MRARVPTPERCESVLVVNVVVRFHLIEKGAIRVDLHEDTVTNDDDGGPCLAGDLAGAVGRAAQGPRDSLHIGIGQLRTSLLPHRLLPSSISIAGPSLLSNHCHRSTRWR